ncbi:7795_t:CDS:1 [Gigaspora margarita]|uniref:7795_t:CDS:1 n=1 Tax=Gigaspora margarita TaxID=4874 RepID=A0ABN7V901_GIGMA|nr:7795_t:CDS:1 [Gigaspora margarita]
MNKGKQPTSASIKKPTSTSAKRKKPDTSPELSSEEEEDYLTRLCSIRIKRYIRDHNQFEIKIFNINYNTQFEITDVRSNDSLAAINNTSSFVYSLLIRITNNDNNGIRFNYNDLNVDLLHHHITIRTLQGYNKGYVGTDTNGNLRLRMINNINPHDSIDL